MPFTTRTRMKDYTINDLEARRIRRRLLRLGKRLTGWPDPVAALLLVGRPATRGVEARLRVRLGHLGGHLVARDAGTTADHAVHRVVKQVERQLEREGAQGRGKPSWRRHDRSAPVRRGRSADPPVPGGAQQDYEEAEMPYAEIGRAHV
jgi:hypothetical protein